VSWPPVGSKRFREKKRTLFLRGTEISTPIGHKATERLGLDGEVSRRDYRIFWSLV